MDNTDGAVMEYATEGSEVTESQDQTSTETPDVKITLPTDFTNKTALADFERDIKHLTDQKVRGSGQLQVNWNRYLLHQRLLEESIDGLQTNVNFINGVRTSTQKKGDNKRSLRYTAQQFYESLSTPMLRAQCTLFSVDYDSYNSQEEIIDTLVEKHLAMAS